MIEVWKFICLQMNCGLKEMTGLLGLGGEVVGIVLVGREGVGNALDNVDAASFQLSHLVGIVGHQPDG